MPKSDSVYIQDMLDHANEAVAMVQGMTREEFNGDRKTQLASIHLVQIIGEAARCVSPATRQLDPLIPWHLITGMRHRIVHDYLNIDLNLLWTTLKADLPSLIKQLVSLQAGGIP